MPFFLNFIIGVRPKAYTANKLRGSRWGREKGEQLNIKRILKISVIIYGPPLDGKEAMGPPDISFSYTLIYHILGKIRMIQVGN